MEQEKKLFKDLKLDDIFYKAYNGRVEEIKVTGIAYYSVTNVLLNGTISLAKDITKLTQLGSNGYFTNKKDAEFLIIEYLEKKIVIDTKDLVLREVSLKERVRNLEELKKKYSK